MKPIDLARAQYDKDSPRTLEEDIAFYVREGWVYSGQEAFVMARPVSTRDIQFALDYKFTFKPATWDCWFVYLGTGKGVVRFFHLAPFALPYIAWHRRRGTLPRIYDWAKFYDKAWSLINKEKYNGKH